MKWFLLCLGVCGLVVPAWARPELSLAQLSQQAASTRLARPESYLKSAAASQKVFAGQGGLVVVPPEVPTVILPDLHAQRDYLLQALRMPMQGSTVFALLRQGKVNVLCLGDGMHSEGRNEGRWLQAEQDFLAGAKASPAMEAEMVESLGLLQMVMDLKVAYPKNFYFVRGNHEDMDPVTAYTKFTRVGESNLVKSWVVHRWGNAFLKRWHACEQSLPLVARGGSFVASHAPPEVSLTVADVQKRVRRAFRACTWSDNTQWTPGGREEKAFLGNCLTFHAPALGGGASQSERRPLSKSVRRAVDSDQSARFGGSGGGGGSPCRSGLQSLARRSQAVG